MSEIVLHHQPGFASVLGEQVRAVGLGLRREAAYLAALLLALALFIAFNAVRARASGSTIAAGFAPQSALPMVALALVLPLAVWKGEEPGRRGYFWSLPVARGPHTLARVAAGWIWLNVAVLGFWAWGLVLALVTSGPLGVQHDGRPFAAWLWVMPFTGATVTYLLGTAVVLVSDHPWRWLAGIAIAWLVVNAASNGPGLEGLHHTVQGLWSGRHGLSVAMTGLSTWQSVAGRGALHTGWSYDAWLAATVLWMALGLVGTVAAAFAHQERMR